MKRRIFAFLLSVAMMVSLIVPAAAETEPTETPLELTCDQCEVVDNAHAENCPTLTPAEPEAQSEDTDSAEEPSDEAADGAEEGDSEEEVTAAQQEETTTSASETETNTGSDTETATPDAEGETQTGSETEADGTSNEEETPSEEDTRVSFEDLPEEDQDAIMMMIYEKEGFLTPVTMALDAEESSSVAPLAEAGYIDAEWFYDDYTKVAPSSDILAGTITESSVPDHTADNYVFVGAFINGIEVLRVGTISYDVDGDGTVEDGEEYVYYVTDDAEEGMTALVLEDGQKITLSYKAEPFVIEYSVTGAFSPDVVNGQAVTVTGIPYGETAYGVVTVLSADRPTEVFRGDSYSFQVVIPRGYTATVTVDGQTLEPELGVTPDWQMTEVTISGDDFSDTAHVITADSEYTLTGTYTVTNVTEDQSVVINITKVNEFEFDATEWQKTKYVVGTSRATSSLGGDSWYSTFTGDTLTWTLTTVQPSSSYRWMLDALQINGTYLNLPFVNGADNATETVLPSGTIVTVSRADGNLYTGNGYNRVYNYVYTITFENCHEDIVVTGGNFNNIAGWNEIIPYQFTGVEDFQFYDDRVERWSGSWGVSNPISMGNGGSYNMYSNGGMKFKLLPGYTIQNVVLKDSDEDTLDTLTVGDGLTLNSDGYYYFNPENHVGNNPNYPLLIIITAVEQTYTVAYDDGDQVATDMPAADSNTYSLNGDSTIMLSAAVPKAEGYVFDGWLVGNTTYVSNQVVDLTDVADYAVNGVITFVAQWVSVENAEQINYTVTVEVMGVDGTLYEYTAKAPNGADLILDINSDAAKEFFAQNPDLEVDYENTDFHYENITEGTNVVLYVKEKTVTINYVVAGGEGGSVNPTTESVPMTSGTAKGSTATPATNYVFEGWYADEACTGTPLSTNAKYDPKMTGTITKNGESVSVYESATYYAKFKLNVGDLKLTKTVAGVADEDLAFTFEVKKVGENTGRSVTLNAGNNWTVTIEDLVVGAYTVTETKVEIEDYKLTSVKAESTELLSNGTIAAYSVNVVGGQEIQVDFTNTYELVIADLTITKTGTADIDENQSHIFTVTGPDNFSMQVVIYGNSSVTIKDLPVGTYTVTEDTNWSWRYKNQASLSKAIVAGQTNTFAFENVREDIYWLNGCAYAENIFGVLSSGN